MVAFDRINRQWLKANIFNRCTFTTLLCHAYMYRNLIQYVNISFGGLRLLAYIMCIWCLYAFSAILNKFKSDLECMEAGICIKECTKWNITNKKSIISNEAVKVQTNKRSDFFPSLIESSLTHFWLFIQFSCFFLDFARSHSESKIEYDYMVNTRSFPILWNGEKSNFFSMMYNVINK